MVEEHKATLWMLAEGWRLQGRILITDWTGWPVLWIQSASFLSHPFHCPVDPWTKGVWRQGLSNANFTRRGRPDYGHYWRPGLPGAGLSPQDDLSPGWQAWWQVDYIRPLPSGTGQCCVLIRCKLLYRGWINNTVLLNNVGDHIHYPVMNIMENRIF